MTPETTWQMKVLALNDTTNVICTVATACAPACDSSIRFYTTDWKPLTADSFITLPVMNDFLLTPDSTAIYYMSKETAEKLKPFLRRPIVYQWKNGAFTK